MQSDPKPSASAVAGWIGLLDTAYGNVPQPPFWNLHRQNIAHAVAYADGTTALISPEQFAALDKSEFFEPLAATPR